MHDPKNPEDIADTSRWSGEGGNMTPRAYKHRDTGDGTPLATSQACTGDHTRHPCTGGAS